MQADWRCCPLSSSFTQYIQSDGAELHEPRPAVPRALEPLRRRARLFNRQVPGLSTISDRPDAFYTMPDSREIIDPLSDGNAHESPEGSTGAGASSLGLKSTAHGDGAEEPTPSVTAGNEENVVTDEPQPDQPGAAETDGEPSPTHSAPKDGPLGPGSGNAAKCPPTAGG